jgi:uncharacterized Zn finger protein
MEENILKGKIRGNHGIYDVELRIDTDPLTFNCQCSASKEMFCKHAAALGLTYIYTPWVFETSSKIERTNISNIEELHFYLRTTKLKTLLEELKKSNFTVAALSEITGISVQQISAIVKDDLNGKYHTLTAPLKFACLYLLEKGITSV